MNCSYYEQITDAYLKGEIEQPGWRGHLKECPDCAARLKSETEFDLLVKHAIHEERVPTRHLEEHVRAEIRKSRSPWSRPVLVMARYAVAASLVLGIFILATFGYAKGRMDRKAVCVDAADDHQEEIVGKAPRRWKSEPADVEALAQRLAGDPSIPARVAPAGYRLVGARICILQGKKYVHLDYSNGSNDLSIFVRRNDPQPTMAAKLVHWFESSGPATEHVENFAVTSVQKKNLSLVMVTAAPLPEAPKLAEKL